MLKLLLVSWYNAEDYSLVVNIMLNYYLTHCLLVSLIVDFLAWYRDIIWFVEKMILFNVYSQKKKSTSI